MSQAKHIKRDLHAKVTTPKQAKAPKAPKTLRTIKSAVS
jgi:hypothetical protein